MLTVLRRESQRKESSGSGGDLASGGGDSSENIMSPSQTITSRKGLQKEKAGSLDESGMEDSTETLVPSVGNLFILKAQKKNKSMYQHYKTKMDQLDEKSRSEMVSG